MLHGGLKNVLRQQLALGKVEHVSKGLKLVYGGGV
jgi:hypothetical protein